MALSEVVQILFFGGTLLVLARWLLRVRGDVRLSEVQRDPRPPPPLSSGGRRAAPKRLAQVRRRFSKHTVF